MLIGKHVEHHPLSAEIDRRRRDLSLFRWGWDFFERQLALDRTIPFVGSLLLCSLSGG